MTTSRQIKQPHSTPVLEYKLLHNGSKESSGNINLIKTTPELYNFSEVSSLNKNPLRD
ncbi:MAG TPA: hypothetical protein VK184_16270 [Nostocaceae cyanobacterium]|nr:hypothetical protein [Nostocaceae cyanobacterium]